MPSLPDIKHARSIVRCAAFLTLDWGSCNTGQACAHLVEVGVSGDVVAPLLGIDGGLAACPGVADPHSLERGPVGRQDPCSRGT